MSRRPDRRLTPPTILSHVAESNPITLIDRVADAASARLLHGPCVLLINAAWSVVGQWSITFGGESYQYFDSGSRRSGIFSCRGYLVIAERDSTIMRGGVRPPDWETRRRTRQAIPWSITAGMNIGPQMFRWRYGMGIIDDRPRELLPGLLLNWQDHQSRGEWYNRGIAVHWLLLSAVSALVPLLAIARHRGRVVRGHCDVCGYDLRATADRCPECGRVPQPESGQPAAS